MTCPILFVAADPRECRPWVARWTSLRKLDLPVHWARAGNWRGHQMIAIANGAGWERAAAAVRTAKACAAVYNIGYCGALDSSLAIGDIFVATEVHNAGLCYRALAPSERNVKSGTLASVSCIVQTAVEKKKLRKTGAFVVEMEAAGAARASEEQGVPFYCVRAVSDLASEDFANDFNRALMIDGRFNTVRLITGAFRSPVSRFAELIRLSRRTSLASKNLGEYLASCCY